jgi:hypothetical protein
MARSITETWCVTTFQPFLYLSWIISAASTTSYPVPSAIRLFNHWSVTSGKGKQSVSQSSEELEVHISPMHIRLDLSIIVQDGGLLSFFEDLLTLQTQYNDQNLVSSETTVDLPRRENNHQRAKPAEQGFFEDPDIHPTDDISPEYLVSSPVSHLSTLKGSTEIKAPLGRREHRQQLLSVRWFEYQCDALPHQTTILVLVLLLSL